MFCFMAHYFEQSRASDAQLSLILMWEAVKNGWTPPRRITRAEYEALRNVAPSPLKGFAGYTCSYGGKWFGSYVGEDSKYETDRKRLERGRADIISQGEYLSLNRVALAHLDYRHITVTAGEVVYCDPPYAGTFRYKGHESFDSTEFWATCESWKVKGAHVFVSEYSAPSDWTEILKVEVALKNAKLNRGRMVEEKLFTLE